jgi:hypothetical protein
MMEFVDVEAPDNFNLFFFGDLHIGSLLFHESGFREALEMTGRPYRGASCNHIVGMGDFIEAIDHSDRRFDSTTTDLKKIRPEMQAEYFEELIRPYRKKFDVLLVGNHEDALAKYFDYTRLVCRNLGINYGTYTSVITYRNRAGELLFKVFASHGRGSIKSAADDPERVEANLNLSLKRKLKNKAADCAIMAMGHTHLTLICKPKKTLYMTYEEGDIRQNYKEGDQAARYIHPDHRYYLNTGTFRRTYLRGVSDYAEKALYDPVVLGFPVVMVRNGRIIDAIKEHV